MQRYHSYLANNYRVSSLTATVLIPQAGINKKIGSFNMQVSSYSAGNRYP